jgi:hypothetical protein
MSPVSNTSEAYERTGTGPTYAAVGTNETGTAGSINVGWSSSAAWSAAAALEIKD